MINGILPKRRNHNLKNNTYLSSFKAIVKRYLCDFYARIYIWLSSGLYLFDMKLIKYNSKMKVGPLVGHFVDWVMLQTLEITVL